MEQHNHCKVSMVIPVYNCESYLERTINSYLQQTLQDWELILVDDGSKDKSWEIINEFVAKDSRIKGYHKENGGCVSARQYGMQYATGDYLIHVDHDDWAEPDFLENLYNTAVETGADMVWCDCFCNESKVWKFTCPEDPAETIRQMLQQKLWGVAWNRLFKTSLAKKYGIVPHHISMWEDFSYCIPILLHCEKIVYCKKPLYHYNMEVENSMVRRQMVKIMATEYCNAAQHLDKVLRAANRLEEFKYDLDALKLFAVRDFIDDKRIRDYNKFVGVFPEAISNIWQHKDYPMRLKLCSALIQNHLSCFVPFVCKVDAVLRRLGLSKQCC